MQVKVVNSASFTIGANTKAVCRMQLAMYLLYRALMHKKIIIMNDADIDTCVVQLVPQLNVGGPLMFEGDHLPRYKLS